MSKRSKIKVDDDWKAPFVEPGAIGMLGFGLSTMFLNLNSLQVIPFDGAILGCGVIFGGICQIISGILNFRRKNTFGVTAFFGFGFYWVCFGFMIILPLFYRHQPVMAASPIAMGFHNFVWSFFALGLFVWSFFVLNILSLTQITFFMVYILFNGLAVVEWLKAGGLNSAAEVILFILGIWGMVIGVIAFLQGIAMLWNDSNIMGRFKIPFDTKGIKKSLYFNFAEHIQKKIALKKDQESESEDEGELELE